MFKFLFVIFFFIILMTLLLGVSFLRTLKNLLFGSSDSEKKARQQQRQAGRNTSQQTRREPSVQQRPKIFTKDVGEYVDYEEIKEKKE